MNRCEWEEYKRTNVIEDIVIKRKNRKNRDDLIMYSFIAVSLLVTTLLMRGV